MNLEFTTRNSTTLLLFNINSILTSMMLLSVFSSKLTAISALLVAVILNKPVEGAISTMSGLLGAFTGMRLFEQMVINSAFLPNGRELSNDPEILQVVESLAAILDYENELEDTVVFEAFEAVRNDVCAYLRLQLNDNQLNCSKSLAFQELHTRLEISNSIIDMVDFTRKYELQNGMNLVQLLLLERDLLLNSEKLEYLQESYYS